MSQSIHVIAPHNLPVDKAMGRVLAWLQAQDGSDSRVKSISTNIDNVAHAITLKLVAYGYPVTATFTVNPSHVELRTSEATDVIEGAAMWFQQGRLQKQLNDALK